MTDDANLSAMGPVEGMAHLRACLTGLSATFSVNDLGLPIPTCPGWTLRDLVVHLNDIHCWVHGAIVEGHPDVPSPEAASSRDALLAQYDEGSSRLVDLLAATDPEESCWTYGAPPHTARFWFRRLAHEHAIHLYDAQSSAGPPAPVDTALAADGVGEVVTVFFPRQVRLGRIAPLTSSLGIRLADVSGREWLLAGDGAGGTEAIGAADAVVGGPAEAVYLLLWRRIGLDDPRIAVEGDPAVASTVLGKAITS